MNTPIAAPPVHHIALAGAELSALGSGALWWPAERLLCISDLHLGKSERMARRGGSTLPPYETQDTLTRLAADLDRTGASRVICLGDSFDDAEAAGALPEADRLWITQLQAGRDWTWIEGNHDPGPIALGGAHRAEMQIGPLTFRHIATEGAQGEVSGHYHPKARIRTRAGRIARPAFLVDDTRLILPAYGTYTGGLDCGSAPLSGIMNPNAIAILTGRTPLPVPMPRQGVK
ncbi:ligase-associated DNA damage response endonuclease PdeM [Chachezhania antarctica]|uniref:ligase-associated DNA damage response endonuclease PdeM n=1 Tax=Chachezhania antarctica TaxID=2340860 RepID=UPI000EB15A98|nr:ligase-associated DNA damage response endonuclease PdeM [Chachezhania antarctica]|tara:strand:+ start:2315 stop:3010 length:696 start_codon:yes stop_codon:yes gene_type:complete